MRRSLQARVKVRSRFFLTRCADAICFVQLRQHGAKMCDKADGTTAMFASPHIFFVKNPLRSDSALLLQSHKQRRERVSDPRPPILGERPRADGNSTGG